jgi:hypothetical protein
VQTNVALQRRILSLHHQLRQGDLGFVGAQAMEDALVAALPKGKLPSLRTIRRILKRHGALDAVRRVRRSAPPAGWYLPEVASGDAELDAFDVIEDLPLEAGPRLDVLTTRALWGSVCGAWVSATLRARWLCERLETHWRQHGCPAYAQFDNDSRFQGTHTHPDVLGQVIRCCLSLGIAPVFAPAREHGPQNLNESFNHLWQQKVWQRFHHASPSAFQATSDRFVAAYQQRRVARDDQARHGERFRSVGNWICNAVPTEPSFACAARTARVRSRCWDIVGGWTRCGFTAWCEPRWTWMKIKSAATGCVVALRTTNPWSKPSARYFQKNIFIPPDQHQMTPRFSHFH